MSYEFKKLSDVKLLEEVPEGANALIEADGVICKVPGSNLGGGNSIPTAILKTNLLDDSDSGAGPISDMPSDARASNSVYRATCENMTFEEVKAIFTSGGFVNARLLSEGSIDGEKMFFDAPSISGGYYVSQQDTLASDAASDIEFVGFSFIMSMGVPSDITTFLWGSNGIISTDWNEVIDGVSGK